MKELSCVIPASSLDVERLLPECVDLCFKNVSCISEILVVTPNPSLAQDWLDAHEFRSRLRVISDDEVLPTSSRRLSGWVRQQLIKLGSYKFTHQECVACLSADTFILRHLKQDDLFLQNVPIMYYSDYEGGEKHRAYEQERLANVAALLDIPAQLTATFVDFIIDFKIFQCCHLRGLEQRLIELRGPNWASICLNGAWENLVEKQKFGEWTAYALYVLDLTEQKILMCNTRNDFFAQVHSQSSFKRICARKRPPSIVHFVSKTLSTESIRSYLRTAQNVVNDEFKN